MEDSATASSDEVAIFCTYYGLLSRKLTDQGQQEKLALALSAARSGNTISGPLSDLLELLGSAVGPGTSPLVQILRIAGVPYRDANRSGMMVLPGGGLGDSVPQLFECPMRRCSRVWIRRPGTATPPCFVYQERLRERSLEL